MSESKKRSIKFVALTAKRVGYEECKVKKALEQKTLSQIRSNHGKKGGS